MVMSIKKIPLLAALIASIGLAGCASTSSVKELDDRVDALEKSNAEAHAKAENAQNTADQAMRAAHGNSEKMKRMYDTTGMK